MSKEKYLFVLNGGYCIYYPSNIFSRQHSFETWGIDFSDIPQIKLENIQSHDVFRPIMRKQKLFMDCKDIQES